MTKSNFLQSPFQGAAAMRFALSILFSCLLALSVAASVAPQGALAQESAVSSSININSADAQGLADGLVGVGLSRAEAIVRYRETYGPFSSAEELMEVKGVGQSTLDKNRARITLE